MAFQAGESFSDDAEAVMNAAEALSGEDFEATESFDRAAQVVGAMLGNAEEVIEEAEAEGRGAKARKSADTLSEVHEGLTALANGEEPDDVDSLTEHVRGLAQAYVMQALERQLAAALGGA